MASMTSPPQAKAQAGKAQRYDLIDVARSVRERAEELGLTTDRFAHLLGIDPVSFDAIMNYRLPAQNPEDVLSRLYFAASISQANPMTITGMGEAALTTWLTENAAYVTTTSNELSRIRRKNMLRGRRAASIFCAVLMLVAVVVACLTGARLYEMVQAHEYTTQQLVWQITYVSGAIVVGFGLLLAAYDNENDWKARRSV